MWLSFCVNPQDTGDSRCSTESDTPFDQSKQAFLHTDPSDKTIVAEGSFVESLPTEFAISSRYLLSCITKLQMEGIPQNHVVEWEKWGPHGTRCFVSSPQPHLEACYGTRFVKRFSDREGGILGFDIFDMNQWPIRRALCGDERQLGVDDTARESSGGWQTVSAPSVLEPDGDSPFAESVVTSLPYRHKRMPIATQDINDNSDPAVMLTEDAIFIAWVVKLRLFERVVVRILLRLAAFAPLLIWSYRFEKTWFMYRYVKCYKIFSKHGLSRWRSSQLHTHFGDMSYPNSKTISDRTGRTDDTYILGQVLRERINLIVHLLDTGLECLGKVILVICRLVGISGIPLRLPRLE